MRVVSSAASAGTFTGSSCPLIRSAGEEPTLKWTSEAPFFTAAARNWLKVFSSIRGVPCPSADGEHLVGAAQAVRQRPAEGAIDLHRQRHVRLEEPLEVRLGQLEQAGGAQRGHPRRGEQ